MGGGRGRGVAGAEGGRQRGGGATGRHPAATGGDPDDSTDSGVPRRRSGAQAPDAAMGFATQ